MGCFFWKSGCPSGQLHHGQMARVRAQLIPTSRNMHTSTRFQHSTYTWIFIYFASTPAFPYICIRLQDHPRCGSGAYQNQNASKKEWPDQNASIARLVHCHQLQKVSTPPFDSTRTNLGYISYIILFYIIIYHHIPHQSIIRGWLMLIEWFIHDPTAKFPHLAVTAWCFWMAPIASTAVKRIRWPLPRFSQIFMWSSNYVESLSYFFRFGFV